MKILHVITSLKIGGAESALYNLLCKLKNDGNEHLVVYFYHGPNVLKIQNLGIKTYQVKGLIKLYDPFFYFRLRKIIKKIKPDIIHSALWSANFFSRLIAKKLNIPIICDLHSNFLHDGKLRNFIERVGVFIPAKYVAVSNTAKDGFLTSVINKINNQDKKEELKSKLLMIQNGIDVDFIRQEAFDDKLTRHDLGFDENDFIIGAVGRLEPIKSYDILLKAFALFLDKTEGKNNLKLCIVGDGSQKNELENLAKKMGVYSNVNFVGQRTDAYRFYPIFDCFALSSVSEGLSISMLEALCFGLPIITTHKNLKHDVIVDGKNGFLVPVGDLKALADAMQKLYSNSELSTKMKKDNLNLIRLQFEMKNVALKYQKLYDGLQV